MVTTSFLACTAPRAVAPAMNDRMYDDAATQANLATLRERGVHVIEPDAGPLASRGEFGAGRLPAPERLLAEVEALRAGPARAVGRPAGPGHRRRHPRADRPRSASSATARAAGWGWRWPRRAAARGAEVTLVAANVALPDPPGVRRIASRPTAELRRRDRGRVPRAHTCS